MKNALICCLLSAILVLTMSPAGAGLSTASAFADEPQGVETQDATMSDETEDVFSLEETSDMTASEDEDAQDVRGASEPQEDSAQLFAMQSSIHDLNALWKSQANGTSSVLNITEGGVYELTADLETTSWITVNARGADVVIDLKDHVLTAKQNSKLHKYVIGTKNCASLTVKGSRPFAGVSATEDDRLLCQIVVSEGEMHHVIDSTADKTVVQNVGIDIRASKDYMDLTDLDACGISATKGEVSIVNCAVTIDHGLQTRRSEGFESTPGYPKAIYLGKKVTSASVERCDLHVIASSTAERPFTAVYGPTTYDNAYGIYSEAEGLVTVKGGSIDVEAPRSAACGIRAKKAQISELATPQDQLNRLQTEELRKKAQETSTLSIKVSGMERAIGMITGDEKGITLNAPVDIECPSSDDCLYSAAVMTMVEKGIVVGKSFNCQNASVLAGTLVNPSNPADYTFAVFDSGVTSQKAGELASMFSNASPDSPCTVANDASGIFFKLDPAKSPVELVGRNGSSTAYTSIDEALAAQKSGEKVRLLKDAGDVSISSSLADDSTKGRTLTLDLNGHTISTLIIDSDEDVEIVSSSGRGTVNGYSTIDKAAVYHAGKGDLSMAGIDIIGVTHAQEGNCVRIVGATSENDVPSIELIDVTMQMASNSTFARGVQVYSGYADILLDSCDIDVSTTASGVSVIGVDISSSTSPASLVNTVVKAYGYDSKTGGVSTNSSLSVSGDEGKSSITGRTQKQSDYVFGIDATNNKAVVSITNARIEALCDKEAKNNAYWCLMTGSTNPLSTVTWELHGKCSFNSATDTHIAHKTSSVRIASDFATEDAVCVQSASLDSHRAFELVDAASSYDISALCTAIEPVAGSPYEGWRLAEKVEKDATYLAWTREDVVENLTSHRKYASFVDAVAASRPNDELRLLGSFVVRQEVEIPHSLKLDLGGNSIKFKLDSSSIPEKRSAAMTLKNGGTLQVKNGSVSIDVDGSSTLFDRTFELSAISAEDKGAIQLDSCTIAMAASGDVDGKGTATLIGLRGKGSKVTLSNGSAIDMKANSGQPILMKGVLFDEGETASSLDMDGSSRISLDNSSLRKVVGSIANEGTQNKAYISQSWSYNKDLMRFYPQEGTDLYNEIQAKFKEQAKADVKGDDEGHAYDTNIYYAAPLLMDDGSYIWAYSDVLTDDEIGHLDNIKASYFFSQTYHDAIPESNAVTVASSKCDVSISGQVSASCSNGSALALASEDGAEEKELAVSSVNIAGSASIDVKASPTTYREQKDPLDLRDLIDGVSGANSIVYPLGIGSKPENHIVEYSKPVAKRVDDKLSKVAKFDPGANIVETIMEGDAGKPTGQTLTAPVETMENDVAIVVGNLRDASGRSIEDQVFTQAPRTKLSASDITVPTDYSVGGIIYRFIGYTVGKLDKKTWRHESLEGLVLDEATVDSSNTLSIDAVYVPVLPNQNLVRFNVDRYVDAYGVPSGLRPNYLFASASVSTGMPSKQDRESSNISYRFMGWRAAGSDARYTGFLPRVSQDTTFIAEFSQTPLSVSTNYYSWVPRKAGGYNYTYTIKRVTYGTRGEALVASVAEPGDIVYTDDSIKQFSGWSPRRSDKEPLYGETPPVIKTSSSSVFAVYKESDRMIPVSFYVDGELYAQSEPLLGTTTVNGAFAATNAARPADKSDTLKFNGWALEPNGDRLMGAVRNLSSLTTGTAPVTLYAVYGAVSIEEEDGKNDDPGSSLLPGGLGGGKSSGPASGGGIAGPSSGISGTSSAGDDLPMAASASASDSGNYIPSSQNVQDAPSAVTTTISFILMLLLVGAFIAFAIYRRRRDQRLDQEDDFFEPAAATNRGEQVIF